MIDVYYVYQLRLIDESLPFYVGKGKGRRIEHHFLKCSDQSRSYKNNIIRKALREGRQIVREFIKWGMTEEDALMWEVFYIAEYGRRDLGLGPLANLTDGGDGISGYMHREETKAKIRNQRWSHTEETKARFKDRKSRIFSEDEKHEYSQRMRDRNSICPHCNLHCNVGQIPWHFDRCVENPNLILESRSIKNHTEVECPHCSKKGNFPIMQRWHFDNCKKRGDR